MRFVDTNVLLYALRASPGDERKRQVALDLLTRSDLVLSVQVLQEFYAQATRLSAPGALSHDEAAAAVESLTRFPVQAMTLDVLRLALTLRPRFGLSYWDSAIPRGGPPHGAAISCTPRTSVTNRTTTACV